MAPKVDNPHDKRFKELFSNKKSFLSLLRDYIKEDWVNDLDEGSLVKSGKSYILQDFSEMEADIVYEASLGGGKIIFYILYEIQSYVDYRMPYRLLLYMVEILRDFYNNSDVKERVNKEYKFPVVFPIVFYSGRWAWTVPLSLNQMFEGHERFGAHVLNFEYRLVDAKGFRDSDLKALRSRLLSTVLTMEVSKNDIEFYNNIRKSLADIKEFDPEETRIFNLFIKIMDIVGGMSRSGEIQKMLKEDKVEEADRMLCDIVENVKRKEEQLLAEGETKGRLEIAKAMLRERLPIDFIIRITNLQKEDIEGITV